MPDNLKKKKLDRQRVSLTQKYEVRDLIKSTKDLLKKLQKFKSSDMIWVVKPNKEYNEYPIKQVLSIRRICKALLKCLK